MGFIWDKISGVSEGFEAGGTIQSQLRDFSVLDTTALALLVDLEGDKSIYQEGLTTMLARTLFIQAEDHVSFYQEVKAQAHEYQEKEGFNSLGFRYASYLEG